MKLPNLKKIILLGAVFASMAVFLPFSASADSYGDKTIFNIDKTYDSGGRAKLASTLVWAGNKIYFYVDDQWWSALPSADQVKYSGIFQELDSEFAKNIRPKLTAVFGDDTNPAVNVDGKITLLIHPMVKDAGGYINTGDGYTKYEVPVSNAREMIYFNTRFLEVPLAKAYLAHEFTHLITFNQKDRLRNVSDGVWMNEARAEYSSTILGYDNPYAGSNFEQRVRSFSADSSKGLVVWANKPANYGAAHLFIQYLVDQYGINILSDTMATDKIGIDSVNYALRKRGASVDFVQVFRNWLVALAANDCKLGPQYCYKFPGLNDFNIAPRINYLPNSDQVSFSVIYGVDYFSGSWQKIVGGGGNLSLNFSSDAASKFAVPYLLCYAGGGECRVGDLAVGSDGKAVLSLPDFGRQYASLMLMPFSSGRASMFDNYNGGQLSYSFKVDITPKTAINANSGDNLPGQGMDFLLAKIEQLKQQIAQLKAILAARLGQSAIPAVSAAGYSCKAVTTDLYFGVENYSQVFCLQQVLKSQGTTIYPQGIVSGRFGIDTQAAVVRFQEKYASEILVPYGFKKGTGYVGTSTRAKVNQLLKGLLPN
jgi:hypothetical protein